jgi:signal transduction histidine kinase
VLEKLFDTVLRKAMEHAGAERGLLIIPRGDELQIEAESRTRENDVVVCLRNASAVATAVPESILRYVLRTRDSVILDEASSANPFSADPYFRQYRVRSILCLPLLNQARLSGILYLENNLAPHVFTPDRITVLRVLVSQAAISLESKVAEEALNRARSELAHVARVTTLNALTASIAHEINQPLASLVTNASICLRRLNAEPPNVEGARETVQRTIRDANRASDVITRLRALFNKKELALEPLDLNETAREVIDLSLSDLQRNRVILRSELADDLPPVTGDRVQLQEVILNLLRNASEAMSTVDDHPRELLVRTEHDKGDQVRLTVRDVGVGFTPESAAKLFQAFYTTKNDGMGIGLHVSHSIIEGHHGRLWATANDGPGATFSFAIPCRSEGLADIETGADGTDPGANAA